VGRYGIGAIFVETNDQKLVVIPVAWTEMGDSAPPLTSIGTPVEEPCQSAGSGDLGQRPSSGISTH
jgi:hypothetical protein